MVAPTLGLNVSYNYCIHAGPIMGCKINYWAHLGPARVPKVPKSPHKLNNTTVGPRSMSPILPASLSKNNNNNNNK